MALTTAGLTPANVTVAGTGGVFLAPEGTALPPTTALTTDPADPWRRLGYTTDDGVEFTLGRESEDLGVWESMDPVRSLVTGEPKEIAFSAREFSADNWLVAASGGTLEVVTGVVKYTAPAAGSAPVYAMQVVWVDGASTFKIAFPRVTLSDDVEFNLQRGDSINLPLTFKVLASATPWELHTDDATWVADATVV